MFYAVSIFAAVWILIMAYYYYANPSDKFIYKISMFVLTIAFQLVATAVYIRAVKNYSVILLAAANAVFFAVYAGIYMLFISKKIKKQAMLK